MMLLSWAASSVVCRSDSLHFEENAPRWLSLAQGDAKAVSVKLKHSFAEKEFRTLNGFDPTGRYLVMIGQGSVSLWDTGTGKLKLTLGGYKDITKADFVRDGRTIVTTGKEKGSKLSLTKLWDVESGALKVTLDGFIVFGPKSSGGNDPIAITISGKEFRFWNATTGELKKTAPTRGKGGTLWEFFLSSVLSPDARHGVADHGKKLPLWDTETGTLITELVPPQDKELFYEHGRRTLEIDQARFAPDSKTIATVDSYDRVELWEATTGILKATLAGHLDSIYNIKFSEDSRLLATSSRDGTARVWDVLTGQLKHTFKAGHQIARRVEFSPDALTLGVGYQNRARLWNVDTGQLIAELPEDKTISRATLLGTYLHGIEIRFSPDCKLLLAMGDKTITAWDAKTGKFITAFEGARSPAVFSSNGKLLATSGVDKNVLLWEISSP